MKKTSALILAVSMVCVFIYGTSFAEGFNTDIPVFEDNNKNIPIPTAIAALIPAPDYAKTIAKAKTILNNPGDCSVKEGFKLTNTLFDISMDNRFTLTQRKEALKFGKAVRREIVNIVSNNTKPIPAPDYSETIAKAKTILNNPGDCSVKEGFKLTNTLFDIAMDDRFTSKQRKEAFNLGKKMNKTMIHMILRP